MTYFPDLSPFRYGLQPAIWTADGPPGVAPEDLYEWPGNGLGEGAFALPELNVGWLDPPHDFPRGPMAPELSAKLEALCAASRYHMMRGVHHCGFCRDPKVSGTGEIRIAGEGVVYAAPRLIAHYVSAHQYAPPEEFVRALAACDGLAQPDPAVLRPVTPEMIPREPVPLDTLRDELRAHLESSYQHLVFTDVSSRDAGDEVEAVARIIPRPGAEAVSRTWRIPRAALLNVQQAVEGMVTMLNRARMQMDRDEQES